MEGLIAVGIGLCIGFSPIGRIPAVKLFITAMTGGQYIITIPKSIVTRVPYVGPVVSGVGLALDVKDIVESATPIGAAKIIAGRLINECTPPRITDRR